MRDHKFDIVLLHFKDTSYVWCKNKTPLIHFAW